ncbi:hypothetical protein K2173_026479 [Erythroxylum novogranatense]|uniref:Uncharacterized protein n=1 Tax=Erythroxylum novogranatense TaxID=1862640 RepID=A0AAV8TWK7_9ROSI|nr:hypothetical protein K2173_026479 [Erythroxylum novogranatense]
MPSTTASCHRKYSTMFTHKTSPFLHKLHSHSNRHRHPFHHYKIRYVLDNIVVSSSLSSVLTSANVIAAAASSGSSSVHSAVSSTITQVAVMAFAIASSSCLSTKVDFLWPKVEEQPGFFILDGVDVTGYSIFNEAKVYCLNWHPFT